MNKILGHSEYGRGKTSGVGCRHIQLKYASPDMTLHVVGCDGFGFGGYITNIANMYIQLISDMFSCNNFDPRYKCSINVIYVVLCLNMFSC